MDNDVVVLNDVDRLSVIGQVNRHVSKSTILSELKYGGSIYASAITANFVFRALRLALGELTLSHFGPTLDLLGFEVPERILKSTAS